MEKNSFFEEIHLAQIGFELEINSDDESFENKRHSVTKGW
jgi:hypothetical protein